MTSFSSFQPDGGKLHRAIVEQARETIIFAGCDGIIRLWNRGAEVARRIAADAQPV